MCVSSTSSPLKLLQKGTLSPVMEADRVWEDSLFGGGRHKTTVKFGRLPGSLAIWGGGIHPIPKASTCPLALSEGVQDCLQSCIISKSIRNKRIRTRPCRCNIIGHYRDPKRIFYSRTPSVPGIFGLHRILKKETAQMGLAQIEQLLRRF